MGNSCCPAESPCGSAEERSELLKDDSKTTAPTSETVVVGTDDIRKMPNEANMKVEVKAEVVHVKQSAQVAETKPNNTQENGPLQKTVLQTAMPSSSKGSELKDNSTRAQDEDMKGRPPDRGQAELLQCTFNSPQTEHVTSNWEVFTATNAASEEHKPASMQDKIPDSSSLTAEAVCAENHTETNTREHITLNTAHDNDEEAGSKVTIDNVVAEPSGEFSLCKVLSAPNTQLTAAACQVSSISVVSEEIDKESLSCAVTEDSENGSSSVCKEAGPEVTKSHDVSESSPGSEPTGLNHSGEERGAANSVREPETTAPADASESSKSDQDTKPDLECTTMRSKEVTSLENIKQDIMEEMMLKGQDKDGDVPQAKEDDEMKEEAENAPTEAETQAGKDAEIQEGTGKEEQLAGGTSTDVKADKIPVTEKEDSAEEQGNSEEDLYRGAEELSASQENKPGPPPVLGTTLLKVEDRCSLAPAVDILSYSEREWKGNTAKSALIRKGYKEMSQRFGSLRRVRGDNYCALRATLFQVLSHSTQLPAWLQEEDITVLPKQLDAQEGLISQWTFPGECLQGDGTADATLQLKGYMELLRNKWQAAVDCSSAVERQQLCERVFQGGEEELGLLEALKLLMLGRAVELHSCMQGGRDVPLFCWLLFARDSSDCPRSFLCNHLSQVGLSAGLEQVEMFLLGYALQCTIQVYRLYKADTEEFVTYYPDDHKDNWPSVCLITEDDRHYNVPVVEAAELHRELNSS
ncbi:uncharacterized protein LOC122866329 [Siniperca chuatsi]|uniref:uncharacterized protein LOC122866329 n=1 Tax=Siniperca chuatsi TaxID=119488 RepID=UPI001CE0F1B4|nr:uncharacterized protein LOC122866329 [Siniperca chuatsi]XP_044031757.1 uncharacterized protein LOC122866329 [Siniperca chuatsi]XP_044031758.1 uncharacterized protein LOC122866329 [Siniperca chuatsi]XP_044031759.1 uncharacterized protein LOC122866329 [Siniperca chuatsi]XP_044031760.1 uncharacterized protein LOC122866329 [Siniperca chuatsi]XP_044031761.1 uncharacterized protein LOC122866329 [Siniperca chuatsi]